MVKNIIFDVGKVIIKFDRSQLVRDWYHGSEENFQTIKNAVFKDWEKTDEGTITQEEFLQGILASLPKEFHEFVPKIITGWIYNREYVDGALEAIKGFKQQGYKLYVLSNMPFSFINERHRYEAFSYFDGEVYSAPIKMLKPNRDIYEYLLNKYNLIPNECLFIDDLLANVETAKNLGINIFQFKNDYNEVKKYLDELNK